MIIAAFIAGLLASMGVGGGMILIVYLTAFAGVPQLAAQGINLVYFLPIAALSVIIHSHGKMIEWRKIVPSIVTGVFFAAAGCALAYFFGSRALSKLFAVFIIALGAREMFVKNNPANHKDLRD